MLIRLLLDLSSLVISFSKLELGPTQVREMQLLQGDCITGEIYCIDTEAFNSGVPYADSFTVKTHICAYKDTAKSCRVTVKAEIVFKKELWNYLKGKIGERLFIRQTHSFKIDLKSWM